MDEKFTEKRTRKHLRSIWINDQELENWNSKKIHKFLEGNHKNHITDSFKRLYEIMNHYLLEKTPREEIVNIPKNILNELQKIEEVLEFV